VDRRWQADAGGGLLCARPTVPEYGWHHFAGGEQAQETKAEFQWPLGDIVTALARAGLRIDRLEEFPSQQGWRFGDQADQVRRLPGSFLLLASAGDKMTE
jgi:hypothetical protein